MAEADFGDRLKRLVIQRKTKLSSVAEASGVPRKTIENWTAPARKTVPRISDAVAVAKVLGTTVDFLATGETPRVVPKNLKDLIDDLVLLDEEELEPIRTLARSYASRHREAAAEGG